MVIPIVKEFQEFYLTFFVTRLYISPSKTLVRFSSWAVNGSDDKINFGEGKCEPEGWGRPSSRLSGL